MSYSLGSNTDTTFTANGIPFERGHLMPFFETDNSGARTGKIALRYKDSFRNDVYPFTLTDYSDITNLDTGLPFASLAALDTFIIDNVYRATIGSSGSGLLFAKTFYIVAAPVASNEKAAGATFSDTWLDGITPTLMVVNNENYSGDQIYYDDGTDSIGIDGGAFAVGTTVVVFRAA